MPTSFIVSNANATAGTPREVVVSVKSYVVDGGASVSSSACGYIQIAESTDAVAGLLIVSVYRPDVYEDALRSIGVARDLLIVLDRRVGDRRQHVRMTKPPRHLDRRRIDIAEQLRTSGWAYVSPHERETLSAITAPQSETTPHHT